MTEDLVSGQTEAWFRAAYQVELVRDSPVGRYALAERFYRTLGARRAGYGRAELSFLRWEIKRGVLNPPWTDRPGSPWWRALNERLLRDKIEAGLLWPDGASGGRSGAVGSARSVSLWVEFLGAPSPASWFRAHNASILGGYLDHHDLALRELPEERWMMNVALLRVIFAHALIAAPRLALGALAPLGRRLGDPRTVFIGLFLNLCRAFPQHYPLLGQGITEMIAAEHRLARYLDRAVIWTRPAALYEFAARVLGLPDITLLVRGDQPCYAGPFSGSFLGTFMGTRTWTDDFPYAGLIARATRPR